MKNNIIKPSQIDNREFTDSLAQNVQMEHLMSRFVDYFKKNGDAFRPFDAGKTEVRYGTNKVNFAEKYRNIKGYEAIDIDLFDMKDGMMIPNEDFYTFMSFYEKLDTNNLTELLSKLDGVGIEKVNGILVPYDKARRGVVKPEMEAFMARIAEVYSDEYFAKVIESIKKKYTDQGKLIKACIGSALINKEIDKMVAETIMGTTADFKAMIKESNIDSIRNCVSRTNNNYYESIQDDVAQDLTVAQNEMVEIAEEHGARLITNVGRENEYKRAHLVVGDGKKSRHTSIMSHDLAGSRDKQGRWTNRPHINYYGAGEESIIRDIPNLGK